MFAVIANAHARPIDSRLAGGPDHDVEIVGHARHVAIICSKAGPSGIARLGGRYWIVGRIRLDAPDELKARLSDHIPGRSGGISDAQLCLHAYAAWGDAFVDRIAGDFCFALWDGERERLVCARDQLGVRCLFHAEAGGSLFASDSLDWVAAQGPVARDLDDTWIADFLGVGYSLDVERTVYRDVRRLAPAHRLVFSDAGTEVCRYWRLELGEPLHFRDRRLYAERFLDVLLQSVADRLPAGRVGISMSGGLDSTTLAACAVRVTGDPSRVVAETAYYERSMQRDEARLSSLVARHLGIEQRLLPADGLDYDPQWRSRPMRTAEPRLTIVAAHLMADVARDRGRAASVWLYGEGPDNALDFEHGAYLSWLAGRRDWLRLGEALLLHVRAKGLAGWWSTFARLARRPAADEASFAVPPWLDRDLVQRLALEERFGGAGAVPAQGHPARHPWHPRAMASFGDPLWSLLFDDYEFEESLGSITLSHPFLDLRVLQFMLSVPPVPWGRGKLLLREAMRGRLPAEVLARDKTSFPVAETQGTLRMHGLPGLSASRELGEFVDLRVLPTGFPETVDSERIIAVHALDHWLATRLLPRDASVVPGVRRL